MKSRKSSKILSLVMAFALSLAGASGVSASPGIHFDRPYEWTIEITTKQQPREFRYHDAALRPVVKTELVYYNVDHEDDKVKYECLWYGNDKSIGLERLHSLDISQADAIAIRVRHSSDSPSI